MSKITLIEITVLLVAIIYCIQWIVDPDGNFEPIIALCAILITSIDIWRRHFTKTNDVGDIETVKDLDEVDLPTNTINDYDLPAFDFSNSCSFFAARFSQAFPGLRRKTWFEGPKAVERLKILLSQPLLYSRPDNGWVKPIGWLRDGNMPFDDFEVIDRNTVIIDSKELKVKKICAVFMMDYKQLFVYLESEKMQATGVYERTHEDYKNSFANFGYVYEEYGLYKDSHYVTRAEYDDNAAVIMGKPISLEGQCKIRTRYLTPYNMVITASGSSINQISFDETLEAYMNRMINGEECMDSFIEEVKSLPSSTAY
jgi:hypothetical protein